MPVRHVCVQNKVLLCQGTELPVVLCLKLA
ncbi:hypothetical protein RO3G_10511 [Rhizopus delemar RA 99-880]|uniref:Uncharacterized protein n=1 Tax=Rhizopus delemar (strain RA 99-880 / ATCC MYA-4621 / FGSC 9543 / NRRL 43880) TaxID=246409 RepID=I1CBH1_RHIO9|nr:hypothetical protein RO3G_10511 [Rhizopus delemar RA 99-880]|eukprot:EIE85801.1 hypothetical protein RO3G_10511 [Rhizopus delemar RA 99-880]